MVMMAKVFHTFPDPADSSAVLLPTVGYVAVNGASVDVVIVHSEKGVYFLFF